MIARFKATKHRYEFVNRLSVGHHKLFEKLISGTQNVTQNSSKAKLKIEKKLELRVEVLLPLVKA